MTASSREGGPRAPATERPAREATRGAIGLTSGRQVELRASRGRDELTVRDASGTKMVSVEVTSVGLVVHVGSYPLELRTQGSLTLAADELELRAARELRLHAGERVLVGGQDVVLEAERNMLTTTGGNHTTEVGGARHSRTRGPDRVESSSLEVQANDSSVRLRAMDHVSIDAEHIGLNDDPCPRPFAWSAIGLEGAQPKGPGEPAALISGDSGPEAAAATRCPHERVARERAGVTGRRDGQRAPESGDGVDSNRRASRRRQGRCMAGRGSGRTR